MATFRGNTTRGVVTSLGHLLRGGGDDFFDLFESAAANVVRAAELLEEMLLGFPDTAGLARDILICEQDGDVITHEVISRINHSLVTPIDRDDILRLVSSLDDIVDFTEKTADYLGLYSVEAAMMQAQAQAHILVDATREIASAIPLVREFKDASKHTREVHRLENEGDRIVRGAIASLFDGGVDPMVVIRWKDIFERLEDAIDATERAADVLDGIVIKNA